MSGFEFLMTAAKIARELFPSRIEINPEDLTEDELEQIVLNLELQTGYSRKPEYLRRPTPDS